MKTTLIMTLIVLINELVVSSYADETPNGEDSSTSTMDRVLKDYKKAQEEWEFARRTGMSTVTAQRLSELTATNTVQNRDQLMRWFKSLPQAEPASDVRQAEKTAVLKALAGMLPPSEFKAFGLEVLDTEIRALREAKKWEQENYYPSDVIFATFDAFAKNSPDSDVIDKLASYAKDKNVGATVRVRFKAFLTNWQFRQDGPANTEKQADIIIGRLTTPPRHPIPWNVSKNKEKRVEYANSEEYAKGMQPVVLWRLSETSIENDANEQVLEKLGMAAVTQLIRAVQQNGYTAEKRYYLIFLATDILFKHVSRGGKLTDNERECLKPLRQLFDTMPDSGAFCWRHRAAGYLNGIYEKFGVDEKVRYVTEPSLGEPSEGKNVR